MRFVEMEVHIGKGRTVKLPINAEQICLLTPIVVPTGLKGSGDIDITKPGTGIDFGVKIVPVAGTPKEVQKMIEEGNENVRPA